LFFSLITIKKKKKEISKVVIMPPFISEQFIAPISYCTVADPAGQENLRHAAIVCGPRLGGRIKGSMEKPS
jgi:hypothetical protein